MVMMQVHTPYNLLCHHNRVQAFDTLMYFPMGEGKCNRGSRISQQWKRLSSSINQNIKSINDGMTKCGHIDAIIVICWRVNASTNTKHKHESG